MIDDRIPVFPLGLVLLPRMPLPLHIFEERYRMLVSRCIENETEFGIVLHTGSTVQTTGCLARIESVINRYDDGRMDILTTGTERFEVLLMHEELPYLEASVRRYHDISADDGAVSALALHAIATLQEFADVAGYELDGEMLSGLSHEDLSFLLATTDVFSMEDKQYLLELRNTGARLERTITVLRESTSRREMAKKIQQIIGRTEDINHLFN